MNCALSEIFIAGTEPSAADDSHVMATVCSQSGYLATPYCTNTISKVYTIRPGGMSWEKMIAMAGFRSLTVESIPDAVYDLPEYYCPLHNPSTDIYPVSPSGRTLAVHNPNYVAPEEPEVPTDGAIEMPDGTVTGGAIDPNYVDPMYNDENGGTGDAGSGDANGGQENPGTDTPSDGGTEPADGGEGGENSGDSGNDGSEGTTDDGITVWDDNMLSEDPNF